jgi:hypothetical protein
MDPGGNDVSIDSDTGEVTQHDVDNEGNRTGVTHDFDSLSDYSAAVSDVNAAGFGTLTSFARAAMGLSPASFSSRSASSDGITISYPKPGVKGVGAKNLGAKLLGAAAFAIAIQEAANRKERISFHYTSAVGLKGIQACTCLQASNPLGKNASGVYFTMVAPNSKTREELVRHLFAAVNPHGFAKTEFFVAVDTIGIPLFSVDPTRPEISYLPAPPGAVLNISDRFLGWGVTKENEVPYGG